MWMSDPRRIVVNAERITELSDTLTESLTEKARAVQEGRALKSSRGDDQEFGTASASDRSEEQ